MASVKYFRPNGEPDADFDSYKEYLQRLPDLTSGRRPVGVVSFGPSTTMCAAARTTTRSRC